MNDHLISFGKIITNPSDPLEKVSIERLLKGLRTPKPDIEAKVRNLRIIYSIDKKRYNEVKRQLPYVVCGIFNPPFRKVENFAYTEYFIVDIDHIASKGLNLMNVRQNIETDPRVLITFVSPSQDGIKVLFRLKERCCDSGIYSLFYRAFVQKFSEMYQLQQVIDARTSDVSRACFIVSPRSSIKRRANSFTSSSVIKVFSACLIIFLGILANAPYQKNTDTSHHLCALILSRTAPNR